jgi:hypothetical protein
MARVTPEPCIADLGLILGVSPEASQLPIRRSFAEGGNHKKRDAQCVAKVQPDIRPMSGCGDRQSENESRRRLHLKKPKKPHARFVAPFDAQLTIARVVASMRRSPNNVKAEAN